MSENVTRWMAQTVAYRMNMECAMAIDELMLTSDWEVYRETMKAIDAKYCVILGCEDGPSGACISQDD